MPSTTTYSFGDIVLVPFPFTDQTASKRRPAIVISSAVYNRSRPDLIVIAVTSQSRPASSPGEVTITRWAQAGLLKPSVIKPVITTLYQRLVLRRLGRLQAHDRAALESTLTQILKA
jgi:mRNA interferase MazF